MVTVNDTTNTLTLYYATNRAHKGKDRWHPGSYGPKFSDDGMENLRFGRLKLDVDAAKIERYLAADKIEDLSAYLETRAKSAAIDAFPEKLDRSVAENLQDAKLGSAAMFAELKELMEKCSDVLVYVHGFNVSWFSAVGAALALQIKLNRSPLADPEQSVVVVLFTWPSDGMALPFASYKSDRSEAEGSGKAFGRGLLRLRDYLHALRQNGAQLCRQDIHLLCHSMGNYLLQSVIQRVAEFTAGTTLPRLFEHVFMCAPDVDDDVLEPDKPLGRLQEITRNVSVYYNRGDAAMVVSDFTKGNPDRLGHNGAARPRLLHNKVHQIDCSEVVGGLVEHSYYLFGPVNADIRQSIDGIVHDDEKRRRKNIQLNVWTLA